MSGGLGLGLARGTSTDPSADLKRMMKRRTERRMGAPAEHGSLSRAMRDDGGGGRGNARSSVRNQKSTTGVELEFERNERPFCLRNESLTRKMK